LLYWQKGEQELDVHDLLGLTRSSQLDSLPMETLATKFRMIDSVQMPVIVPYDDDAREALKELRFAHGSVGIARRLQPYLVQLPRQGFDALRKAGAIQAVAPEKWGEQFMALMHEDLYDLKFGLHWENPSFIRVEHLAW
jgi:CRISPR-associated endonuclease/helicase Cas3